MLFGLSTEDDVALVIAAPIMATFMYFVAIALVMFVIGFQRVNPFNSPRSTFIKYAILAFWGFGIFGFLYFLSTGLFQSSEFESANYFMMVASVFPLGASVGAAKQWRLFLAQD